MAKSLLSAFLFTNRNAVETRWFRNEGRTLKSQEICGAVTNNVQRKCLYLTIVAPQTSGFPIQKSPTCMILVFFPNCWDPFPIIPNTKQWYPNYPWFKFSCTKSPAWPQEPRRFNEEGAHLAVAGSLAGGQRVGVEEDTIESAWESQKNVVITTNHQFIYINHTYIYISYMYVI